MRDYLEDLALEIGGRDGHAEAGHDCGDLLAHLVDDGQTGVDLEGAVGNAGERRGRVDGTVDCQLDP